MRIAVECPLLRWLSTLAEHGMAHGSANLEPAVPDSDMPSRRHCDCFDCNSPDQVLPASII